MKKSALSTTSVEKSKIHFHFVDSLRGIGATWVMLYHIHASGRLIEVSAILRFYNF